MSTSEVYKNYEYLLFERTGGVLTVRLNRPEAYNAVNRHLHTELSRVFADIRTDRETRAVVITGEGAAFSGGGDLKNVATGAGERLDNTFTEARKIVMDLLELPQPIVAAVNGPAMGLGATLALLCDVVFASDQAKFADPHVRVGVGAGDGGIVIWPWLVGINRAKQYLMTGDAMSAAVAERIGLVNEVVAADELLGTAHAFATRLAEGPQRAIRGTKSVLNIILRDTANMVLDPSLMMEKECFAAGDHVGPVAAFLERKTAKVG
ncbi:enoyl-CoA hydratase/isomerase family protein [Rhodococcus koreensis]|uniref:Enoyl-CoA hydratase n=1 Tax=Rhodococcus koreensis TaxID=99653 RepID=A0A1H4XBN3_9NOCA|nr:enoyl-CoA hydratase-related protein [Rhodococcus koreensis]SED02104.1 enoyl-CoA hydratase [Rhodococcus koreensis]